MNNKYLTDISVYSCPFVVPYYGYQKMQNEPNLPDAQMNLNPVKAGDYENKLTFARKQNEPNLRQIEPNLVLRPVHRNLGEDRSLGEAGSRRSTSEDGTKPIENRSPFKQAKKLRRTGINFTINILTVVF